MKDQEVNCKAPAQDELLPDEIHQMAFEEGQPAEDGDGYLFTAEEFDLFVERLLSRATHPAQTEQQPVSWQFYQAGKWWNGDDRIKDHRKNTEAAGIPVRDLYAAPIAQAAPNSDCEWCAGAGKDHFGEKCEHCQAAPQPAQDDSLNMEPEGDNAYLVVDPDDNYHICYVVRSKDQALQHASDGLLAFGPITQGSDS